MRHYDIAKVSNGTVVGYPPKPLQDMTLDEIKKKYLKTCAKSNGDVSVCSKCQAPCTEGKRAIQLLANEVYNDPPVPLYGGKTLIDWAKAENERRRRFEDKKEEKEMSEPKKRNYQIVEDWWERSLASGDQTAWLMNEMNITKNQAKKKIYSYRYRHGLTDKEYNKPQKKEPVMSDSSIETKMEALMKLQEKQKAVMEEYQKLYDDAKQKYEDIKRKVDILCSAVDILNDN